MRRSSPGDHGTTAPPSKATVASTHAVSTVRVAVAWGGGPVLVTVAVAASVGPCIYASSSTSDQPDTAGLAKLGFSFVHFTR